ncbi:MAG: acyl-ACP--UDP-N-acetylglucosamine O-acyltransferase [Elusimicrobiota bacterium]|jgi:UDP-N-acetylglucosamine acyltransferase|nr:acyl-ACP--UDP-N-acetylglucosamine O-acyltransferase [Elusimicrobiota bacterium]
MNHIHRSVAIDKTAVIEDNVEIGAFSIIGPKTTIRSGVKIHGQAVIEYADIGSGCEIFNFTSIGKRPQDLKYKGEETRVVIGKNTSIRESVTVNRGTIVSGETKIGSNCLLMSCSHIAHDCILGDNVIVGYATGLAGHVEVEDRAIFSGGCGVHQFCKIGKLALVGGGAKVTMDIIPYSMAHGDRAVLVGLNTIGMKRHKMRLADIDEVKNAYKILFMSKLGLEEALEKLKDTKSVYVKDIVEFVKKAQRGVMRP